MPNTRQPEELNTVPIINRISKLEEKFNETNELVLSHEESICHLKSLNIDNCIEGLVNKNKHNSDVINEIKQLVEINKVSQDDNIKDVGRGLESTIVDLGKVEVPSNTTTDVKQSETIYNEVRDESFEQFLDSCKTDDINSLSLCKFRESIETGDNDGTKSVLFDSLRNTYSDITKTINEELPKESLQRKSVMSPVIVERSMNNKNNNEVTLDEDGFRKAKTKNKTQASSSDAIIGAAPTLCTIWVSRLIQGNAVNIKRFMNNKGIRVQKISKTSHEDAQYMSFKITILRSDSAVVLNNGFWPIGVNCRFWKDRVDSKVRSRTYSNSLIKGRF